MNGGVEVGYKKFSRGTLRDYLHPWIKGWRCRSLEEWTAIPSDRRLITHIFNQIPLSFHYFITSTEFTFKCRLDKGGTKASLVLYHAKFTRNIDNVISGGSWWVKFEFSSPFALIVFATVSRRKGVDLTSAGNGFMEIKSCSLSELCMTGTRHNLTLLGLLNLLKHPSPSNRMMRFS